MTPTLHDVLAALAVLTEEVRAVAAVAGADRLVGRLEAAEIMEVSPATFDRMRARGTVPKPAAGDGRSMRWKVSQLMERRRRR